MGLPEVTELAQEVEIEELEVVMMIKLQEPTKRDYLLTTEMKIMEEIDNQKDHSEVEAEVLEVKVEAVEEATTETRSLNLKAVELHLKTQEEEAGSVVATEEKTEVKIDSNHTEVEEEVVVSDMISMTAQAKEERTKVSLQEAEGEEGLEPQEMVLSEEEEEVFSKETPSILRMLSEVEEVASVVEEVVTLTMNLKLLKEEEALEEEIGLTDRQGNTMTLKITNKIGNITSHRENSESKDLLGNTMIDQTGHLKTDPHVEISMVKEVEEAVEASEATTEVALEEVIEEASEEEADQEFTTPIFDYLLESLHDS